MSHLNPNNYDLSKILLKFQSQNVSKCILFIEAVHP